MDFEVNARIRQLRKENGYTQGQLGKILGMKTSTYSQFERKGNVDTQVLKQLVEIFDVDVKYILYGEESDMPQITESPRNKPDEPEIIVSYTSNDFTISVMETQIINTMRELSEKDRQQIVDLIVYKSCGK